MAANENKELARKLFEEVWSRGDVNVVDQLLADGYSAHIPLIGRVDRPGLKQAVATFRKAFPDLKFEIKDTVIEGSKVAVHWMATGTSKGELLGYPPNGKTASVHGLSVIEVSGGRILRDWSEYDVMEMLQSLGVQLPIGGAKAQPQPELRH